MATMLPTRCLGGRCPRAGPLGLGGALRQGPLPAVPVPRLLVQAQRSPLIGGRGGVPAGLVPKQAVIAQPRHVCEASAAGASADYGPLQWFTEVGYGLLGVVCTAVALAGIFKPSVWGPSALNLEVTPLIAHIQNLNATLFLFLGFFSFCVKDAVAKGRLGSATYRRMAQVLALERLANLAFKYPLLKAGAAMSTWLAALTIGTPVAASLLFILAFNSLPFNPFQVIGGALQSAKSLLDPKNAPALLYSVISVTFAAFVVWFLVDPSVAGPLTLASSSKASALTASLGVKDIAVVRDLGLAFVYYSTAAFILKDAADRGRLAASTFKSLNLTVATVALINSAFKFYYYWATKQSICPAVWPTIFVGLFSSYHYFNAEKPSE